MKETIRNSTIVEKIGNDEYTVIISKGDGCYYGLLRMGTKVEGSYSDIKKYFSNLFAKLGVASDVVVKKTRSDKGKSHNYPLQLKTKQIHKGRPKGKPRGPKVQPVKKPSEVNSNGFIKTILKKK